VWDAELLMILKGAGYVLHCLRRVLGSPLGTIGASFLDYFMYKVV
jgi:hypothetical protein